MITCSFYREATQLLAAPVGEPDLFPVKSGSDDEETLVYAPTRREKDKLITKLLNKINSLTTPTKKKLRQDRSDKYKKLSQNRRYSPQRKHSSHSPSRGESNSPSRSWSKTPPQVYGSQKYQNNYYRRF